MSILERLFSYFLNRGKDTQVPSGNEHMPAVDETAASSIPTASRTAVSLSSGTRRLIIAQNPLRPPLEEWLIIRQKVFERDNWRCQVIGCVNSHNHLECHHITPVAQGGSNDAVNLITLCLFHHACQADHDVHSMRNRADTERYWIKPSFRRLGRRVRCHFGRRVLVTPEDLKIAREHFQITCLCGSKSWRGFYRKRVGDLIVLCPICRKGWRMILGVREETCVALAACMLPTTNLGKISPKDFSEDIAGMRLDAEAVSACPYCFLEDGRCGYLVKRNGIRGQYLACSNKGEKKIRCHYSRNI